jgi:ABC-type proline/glycine betaine transport system permease subunit
MQSTTTAGERQRRTHLILLGALDNHVYAIVFDPVARTLVEVNKKEVSEHPTWLTRHP